MIEKWGRHTTEQPKKHEKREKISELWDEEENCITTLNLKRILLKVFSSSLFRCSLHSWHGIHVMRFMLSLWNIFFSLHHFEVDKEFFFNRMWESCRHSKKTFSFSVSFMICDTSHWLWHVWIELRPHTNTHTHKMYVFVYLDMFKHTGRQAVETYMQTHVHLIFMALWKVMKKERDR